MLGIGTVDVAILGGGCAGLSLGVQLAEHAGFRGRAVVLETRTEYTRDRTWCGWSVQPHAFAACVDRSWTKWQARFRGAAAVHCSESLPYEHIRGDAFYRTAQSRLATSSQVELVMGVTAVEVREGRESLEVVTDAGTLSAKKVVDTRPSGAKGPAHGLLQHFAGQEIETQAAVFDPDMATLMDFDVDQVGGLHFVYVLPFTERRALVESTIISPEPVDSSVYLDQIQSYVHRVLGTQIESTRFTETGVIPMHPVSHGSSMPGVDLAGTLGGAIKPSSGYGFHTIQRRSAVLADSIAKGTPPPKAKLSSRLDAWMDRVFLAFLKDHPERGPEVFHRMFKGVPPQAFARFLMGLPSVRDRMRVVSAMPKLPFVRTALRSSVS